MAVVVLAAAFGTIVGAGARGLLARSTKPVVLARGVIDPLTGGAWAVTALAAELGLVPPWWLPVPLLVSGFGVALAAADIVTLRLPDTVTLAAYPLLAVAVGTAGTVGELGGLGFRGLAGVLLFGGAHLAVRLVVPAAIGPGDVKLAGALGGPLGALGPLAPVACAVGAAALTAVLTFVPACRGRRGRRGRPAGVPHGPGLLLACWLLVAFPGSLGAATS